ncbi:MULTISPECIES: glucose-1-phosphate adenylyltransferase [Turicibacter]|jgi:glucose-1-phosphate adenylyltransferase|uniref:Glucose-1-phosphate adenylyltransferase n=3 Tax=Turicibacter sanguinis TaxID=154288 RepID=A0A173T4Y3_9FIRM|nr:MULTISPECIES: glucose-1-phosphate adenylyltransferase [Turicibacter]EFF62760.1 putative glucose-1-phosphate adenylyltransferase [Turicibacter sanguinis PC909]EGC91171.1 putative glucose-1-phosphate adenylyltransferase [Turicibacter sp. HGF1]MBP3903842.1 glucose-1-phosphate adenylyltransferase [Turicibacter sp.]MCU7191655.1 glucose-1-phosphate adenylyltransferase [Turicibacter sanguinis]MCU7197057.1 glucose-1-phosphate adenylyltransferase [Turicibacter sanguinis]
MKTLAMILAGGRGSRLDILSLGRAKPSVPFAGKFRIIDFVLSNCSNSEIYDIGILTQYLPLSLNEHIGVGQAWDFDRKNTGVTLLQPCEGLSSDEWYTGTADAVYQNISYIKRKNPDYVLILSGDHIYKMDYRPLIDQHIKTGADVTVCAQEVDIREASRFGILTDDENGRIIEFEEKPAEPKSNLASMGIYVFTTDVLINTLQELKKTGLDFGGDVIPHLIHHGNVYSYRFNSYWKDVGTYESYLESNLELTTTVDKIQLDMYDKDWVIHTRSEEKPTAKFGSKAQVCQSLISNGSIIAGSVTKCVISPGVHIHPNAIVRNSVIMNDTVIEEGCIIDGAIIDKNVVIGKGSIIGRGKVHCPNEEKPNVLSSGLNVIGKGVCIPEGTIIERNVRIFPHAEANDFNEQIITCGRTIRPSKEA